MPGLDNVSDIAALLHIEEKTRDQPKLKDIHDAAMRQLEAHNADHAPQPPDPALPTTSPVVLTPAGPEPELGPETNGNGESLRRI
jgi:hypothetical protein